MTSNSLPLAIYDQILFQFSFMPSSMERGEDFFVEYNDGSGWQVLNSYVSGIDFENTNIYRAEILINDANYRFNNQSRFRIRCDASSNADRIYIDEVSIIGNPTNQSIISGTSNKLSVLSGTSIFPDTNEIPEIMLTPNPAIESFKIEYDGEISKVNIYTIDGKTLNRSLNGNDMINVSDLPGGIYLVRVYTSEGRILQQKLVKSN